jgi:hypothetical protein
MKIKLPVNIALGIATEILYALLIIAAAFLLCLFATFKI